MHRAASSNAPSIEGVKQLLAQLERQDDSVRAALEHGAPEELESTVDERQRLLDQLGAAVQAVTSQSRGTRGGAKAIAELLQPIATLVAAQEQLVLTATVARTRVGIALQRLDRPDLVARQYEPRARASRGVSVRG